MSPALELLQEDIEVDGFYGLENATVRGVLRISNGTRPAAYVSLVSQSNAVATEQRLARERAKGRPRRKVHRPSRIVDGLFESSGEESVSGDEDMDLEGTNATAESALGGKETSGGLNGGTSGSATSGSVPDSGSSTESTSNFVTTNVDIKEPILLIKQLFITITGKTLTTFTDRSENIEPQHRENVFLKRSINIIDTLRAQTPSPLLPPDNQTLLVKGAIFDIPFEIPFPEIPDPAAFPPPPPGTSASGHLAPPSSFLFGYQTNSPIHTYSAQTKYEISAVAVLEPQYILGGLITWTPKLDSLPVEIPKFKVYDPRLVPSLLHSDIRRWRSAPEATPVEYDMEVGSICMGPQDTLRFAFRVKVSPEAVLRGVRLRSVGILIREHHLVGEQRCQGTIGNPDSPVERKGIRVKGNHEVLRWEHVETPVPKSIADILMSNVTLNNPYVGLSHPGRVLGLIGLPHLRGGRPGKENVNQSAVSRKNDPPGFFRRAITNGSGVNSMANFRGGPPARAESLLFNNEWDNVLQVDSAGNVTVRGDNQSDNENDGVVDEEGDDETSLAALIESRGVVGKKVIREPTKPVSASSRNRSLMTGTSEEEVEYVIGLADMKFPEPRPGKVVYSGDGMFLESYIDLKIPELGKFVPSTPKNVRIPPCPPSISDPLPSSSEVKHTIQVWIDCRGADRLVMESTCVLSSVSKEDLNQVLLKKPQILPNLEYEKLVGSDNWVPPYKVKDKIAKMVDELDRPTWEAICAVLAAAERPQDRMYIEYVEDLKRKRKHKESKGKEVVAERGRTSSIPSEEQDVNSDSDESNSLELGSESEFSDWEWPNKVPPVEEVTEVPLPSKDTSPARRANDYLLQRTDESRLIRRPTTSKLIKLGATPSITNYQEYLLSRSVSRNGRGSSTESRTYGSEDIPPVASMILGAPMYSNSLQVRSATNSRDSSPATSYGGPSSFREHTGILSSSMPKGMKPSFGRNMSHGDDNQLYTLNDASEPEEFLTVEGATTDDMNAERTSSYTSLTPVGRKVSQFGKASNRKDFKGTLSISKNELQLVDSSLIEDAMDNSIV